MQFSWLLNFEAFWKKNWLFPVISSRFLAWQKLKILLQIFIPSDKSNFRNWVRIWTFCTQKSSPFVIKWNQLSPTLRRIRYNNKLTTVIELHATNLFKQTTPEWVGRFCATVRFRNSRAHHKQTHLFCTPARHVVRSKVGDDFKNLQRQQKGQLKGPSSAGWSGVEWRVMSPLLRAPCRTHTIEWRGLVSIVFYCS